MTAWTTSGFQKDSSRRSPSTYGLLACERSHQLRASKLLHEEISLS